MKVFLRSAVLCGLMVLPVGAGAAEIASDALVSGFGNGPLDSTIQSARPAVEFKASQDSGRVSLKWGNALGRINGGGNAAGEVWHFFQWTLTASMPLKKSPELSDIATLDGLANSSALELAIGSFSGRVEPVQGKSVYSVREWDEKFIATPSAKVAWGLTGKVGYEKFDFLDATAFKKASDSRTPWSAKAYLGIIPDSKTAAVDIAYEYQDAFKAQDQKTICPAASGASVVTCLTGALGAPKETKKSIFSFEGKTKLPIAIYGVSVAAAAKLSYEAKSDVFGVDVPVYLVSDEKLSGGIRTGYRSDTKSMVVGIFISTPLFPD